MKHLIAAALLAVLAGCQSDPHCRNARAENEYLRGELEKYVDLAERQNELIVKLTADAIEEHTP